VIFELFTTPKFLKLKKKTTKALQKQLDGNIEIISKNPDIGELKKGDLAGVRVYKFRYGNDQILIAYRVDTINNRIILYAFGTHENFYKKFKKYMRV
jgi:mRNA interferase RelE/StbE